MKIRSEFKRQHKRSLYQTIAVSMESQHPCLYLLSSVGLTRLVCFFRSTLKETTRRLCSASVVATTRPGRQLVDTSRLTLTVHASRFQNKDAFPLPVFVWCSATRWQQRQTHTEAAGLCHNKKARDAAGWKTKVKAMMKESCLARDSYY